MKAKAFLIVLTIICLLAVAWSMYTYKITESNQMQSEFVEYMKQADETEATGGYQETVESIVESSESVEAEIKVEDYLYTNDEGKLCLTEADFKRIRFKVALEEGITIVREDGSSYEYLYYSPKDEEQIDPYVELWQSFRQDIEARYNATSRDTYDKFTIESDETFVDFSGINEALDYSVFIDSVRKVFPTQSIRINRFAPFKYMGVYFVEVAVDSKTTYGAVYVSRNGGKFYISMEKYEEENGGYGE